MIIGCYVFGDEEELEEMIGPDCRWADRGPILRPYPLVVSEFDRARQTRLKRASLGESNHSEARPGESGPLYHLLFWKSQDCARLPSVIRRG